jgi:MYXO-CTERM domain-containing protein
MHCSKVFSVRPYRRFLAMAALPFFAAILLGLASTACASITYDIANYPGSQRGIYTISGSIQTDGSTGIISNTDILSYSISITPDPLSQFGISATNSDFTVLVGQLQASGTTLFLTPGSSLAIYDSSNGNELLYKDTIPNETGGPLYAYKTTADGTLWSTGPTATDSTPGSTIGTDPMTIGIVMAPGTSSTPEPTSLAVWALLGLGGAFFLRRAGARESAS